MCVNFHLVPDNGDRGAILIYSGVSVYQMLEGWSSWHGREMKENYLYIGK